MKRAILLPLLLGSCQFIPGSDASKIKDAETAVAAKLTDPSSAQFRNGKIAQPGLVCGEVNSKNQFGGYVGFTPYAYAAANKSVYIADAAAVGETVCVNDGKQSLCCNGSRIAKAQMDADNAEAVADTLDNAANALEANAN